MTNSLAVLTEAVAALAGQDPHAQPDAALLEIVETLLCQRDRINGVLARTLQVIDNRDATVAEYGRQTRAWLVEDPLLAHEEASKLLTVARDLPSRPAIDAALLAGDINLDHAR